jgi:predicted PurR-regulated permease PerM
METASWILLIVVSSVLAIFLIVLIVAIVYVINILKQVKKLVEQAENVVDSVESAASSFERTVSPLTVFKIVGNIVEQASRMGGRNKKKRG